ncbi:MAG: hypothetical protein AAGI66_04660 [Cyanobacteria bacterium P01_H01_bin.74]
MKESEPDSFKKSTSSQKNKPGNWISRFYNYIRGMFSGAVITPVGAGGNSNKVNYDVNEYQSKDLTDQAAYEQGIANSLAEQTEANSQDQPVALQSDQSTAPQFVNAGKHQNFLLSEDEALAQALFDSKMTPEEEKAWQIHQQLSGKPMAKADYINRLRDKAEEEKAWQIHQQLSGKPMAKADYINRLRDKAAANEAILEAQLLSAPKPSNRISDQAALEALPPKPEERSASGFNTEDTDNNFAAADSKVEPKTGLSKQEPDEALPEQPHADHTDKDFAKMRATLNSL